ncbi:MAG: hypothetical protein AMJ37_01160 [Dehalococcoidia bacterium DG_18]|nr:MAG: hypothetical protein AMJ37_01160 [Dehalococcoidia bacterium DG_18]
MSFAANRSPTEIAKGTAIALVGTVAALPFAFIGRILVARYGPQSDYAVFPLGNSGFGQFLRVVFVEHARPQKSVWGSEALRDAKELLAA